MCVCIHTYLARGEGERLGLEDKEAEKEVGEEEDGNRSGERGGGGGRGGEEEGELGEMETGEQQTVVQRQLPNHM